MDFMTSHLHVMQATLLGVILCNGRMYLHTRDLHVVFKNACFFLFKINVC